jgi:hypothetical protein
MAKNITILQTLKVENQSSTTSINFLDLNIPVMGGWNF